MRAAAAAIIGSVLGAATTAHACGGGKIIYQDGFKTLDPAWNAPDYVTVVNGAMSAKLSPNFGAIIISQANLYTQSSIEICASTKIISGLGTSTDSAGAGIIFWATGSSDFDLVEMMPAAGAAKAVARVDNSKWITKVQAHHVAAVNTGLGGTNDFDVVVNGQRVQASINGKPGVYTIGATPSSSWMVGLYFESPGNSGTEWQVTNFQVREGP